ncbi:ubiquinol-cytochrome C chaperone family protein [Methylobacterium oryzisoli]|uniref:ubiquinol-cytochrome C chaperone family protein n=1 Tax=Methylobacterium oryzisoli TaxID=3385502 RepID=UPI00389244F8
MIRNLFRRDDGRRRVIEALHVRINAAARQPGLYLDLGVPDSVEGRFETLCLHVILMLRRLRQLPAPAEEVAQDLVDSVFAQLDSSLRELGVGDLGVAKRMKKLAQAFYGRAGAYDAALDAGDRPALAGALARNVLGRDDPDAGAPLAAYVAAAAEALGRQDLDALLGAGPVLPDPAAFASTQPSGNPGRPPA